MIAVIFEVRPAAGRMEDYLGIAAELRPMLEATPGFISVERFRSLSDPDRLLSLSFFEDEDAVRRWRTTPGHRAGQSAGRDGVLSHYRLRVAEVVRDYGLTERDEAPGDSRRAHRA